MLLTASPQPCRDHRIVGPSRICEVAATSQSVLSLSAKLSRMNVTRRQFVEQCATAAAAAWLLPAAAVASSTGPAVKFPSDPRKRVAVAAYPFREFIVGWKGWDGNTPSKIPAEQQIPLTDFSALWAMKVHAHNNEACSPFCPPADA